MYNIRTHSTMRKFLMTEPKYFFVLYIFIAQSPQLLLSSFSRSEWIIDLYRLLISYGLYCLSAKSFLVNYLCVYICMKGVSHGSSTIITSWVCLFVIFKLYITRFCSTFLQLSTRDPQMNVTTYCLIDLNFILIIFIKISNIIKFEMNAI